MSAPSIAPAMRRLVAVLLVGLLVTAGCVEGMSPTLETPTAGEERAVTVG